MELSINLLKKIALNVYDAIHPILGSEKAAEKAQRGAGGDISMQIDIIAENIEKEDAINLTKSCLEYYAANGKKKERTARFIERIGIDEFKKSIL